MDQNIQQNSGKKYVWSLISLIFIVIFGLSFLLPTQAFPMVIFPALALIFAIIGWKKKENKKFVLSGIILSSLILVFSIYILVSIVTPSPEGKIIANTANVKMTMSNMRILAEVYNTKNNSYIGLENSSDVKIIEKQVLKFSGKDFAVYVSPDGNKYCGKALLPDGSLWCVDSLGYFGNYVGNLKCSIDYYACE
ncbi:MAG: hypothetical protein ABIG29_00695 [Candidatus Nealsonbacteria bacterium]